MAITIEQINGDGQFTGGSSFNLTMASAPTNGNAIICFVSRGRNSVSDQINSISQTGVDWSSYGSLFAGKLYAASDLWGDIWVGEVTSGSASATLTVNTFLSDDITVCAMEISGDFDLTSFPTNFTQDIDSGVDTTLATSQDGGTIAAPAYSSLAISWFAATGGEDNAVTNPAGWTEELEQGNGTNASSNTKQVILSKVTTTTENPTYTQSESRDVVTAIFTLTDTAAGGGAVSLDATTAVASGHTADLGIARALASTAAATSGSSADISVLSSLAASVSVASDSSADLEITRSLESTTAATSGHAAALSLDVALETSASVSSDSSADLTVSGSADLAASSSVVSGSSADLSVALSLAASTAVLSGSDADLTVSSGVDLEAVSGASSDSSAALSILRGLEAVAGGQSRAYRYNLLSHTETFDPSYWVRSDAAASGVSASEPGPFGGDAFELIADSGVVTAEIRGGDLEISFGTAEIRLWAKAGGAGFLALFTNDGAAADVNLSTGALGNTSPGGGVFSVEADGAAGWWLIKIQWSTFGGSNRFLNIRALDTISGSTVTGDGSTPSVYLWGAQFTEGQNLPYQPAGAAAPFSLSVLRGLGAVASVSSGVGQNLLYDSGDFSEPHWEQYQCGDASGVGSVATPISGLNGFELIADAGANSAFVRQTRYAEAGTGRARILWRAGSAEILRLGAGDEDAITVDLIAPSISSGTATLENVGSGWWLVEWAWVQNTPGLMGFFAQPYESGYVPLGGDGSTVQIYLAAPQVTEVDEVTPYTKGPLELTLSLGLSSSVLVESVLAADLSVAGDEPEIVYQSGRIYPGVSASGIIRPGVGTGGRWNKS